MSNQKAIPVKTQKRIFQEANSQCAFCHESSVEALEIHHINERANGGGNEPENLILVCANCHEKIANGSLTRSSVIEKKFELMVNKKTYPTRLLNKQKYST